MRYSFTKLSAVATIIASCAFSGTAFAAPAPKPAPVLQKIVTSNPYARANKDKFSLHVEIKSPFAAKKTDILIDGKLVKTCKTGSYVCEVTVGPYADTMVGEHVYVFTATNKNGATASQWGRFWVSDPDNVGDQMAIIPAKTNLKLFAHNKNGAGVLELITTKKQYSVGEKGTRLLLMRGHANVKSISYIETLDGIEVDTGEISGGTYSWGKVLGPFTTADVGEHVVSYTVIGKSGGEITTSLQYWVVANEQTLLPPAP